MRIIICHADSLQQILRATGGDSRPFPRDSPRLAALQDKFACGTTVGSHGGIATLWEGLHEEYPGLDWAAVTPAQVQDHMK